MITRNPARLLAEDDELVALLRQAEDVLLALAAAEEDVAGQWHLPAPLAGRATLDALYRVWEQLTGVLDALRPGQPPGPRLLAPDGRYEHVPLRIAELDPVDLQTLAAALGVLNHALASGAEPDLGSVQRRQLDDLAELLDTAQVDVSLWPRDGDPATPADLLRPLARLVAVLDMPPDPDTNMLLGVLRERAGAGDVVLTLTEEAAYQRVVDRLNLVVADADPLTRFLY